MRLLLSTFLTLALMSVSAAKPSGAPAAAEAWRLMTQVDIDAAYRLLKDNHPGAVAETNDPQFVSALAVAHAAALQRAQVVSNYEGYTAVLGEFAIAMGDGHISSRPVFVPRTLKWAGIVAAKRGTDWVVASDEPKIVGQELAGARILTCDGAPIDVLAHDVLHFRGIVSVPATSVMKAVWLFIDTGNPYAGFGVRASGSGYWIGIKQLTPEAQAVIDKVRAEEAHIRSASYVVVDLRGNDGGADSYGRALAEQIYGPDFVQARLGPKEYDTGGCQEVFRASADNILAIGLSATEFQKAGDAIDADGYTRALAQMKAAAASGRPLAGNLTCPQTVHEGEGIAARPHGKIFVLTDAACFSSCIEVARYFRQLGAIHVGQATSADTRYSEVRRIVLPSGLSALSTLQAVTPDAPLHIGPYEPKYEFAGDIADTAAFEKWIADLSASARD